MENKLCTYCGDTKALEAFGTQKRKLKSGETKIVPREHCKDCKKAYNKAYYHGIQPDTRYCVRCTSVKAGEEFPLEGKTLRRWCLGCDPDVDERYCTQCKNFQGEWLFNKPVGTKGYGGWCEICRKAYGRRTRLAKNYGMTIKDYMKMYDDQHGECAICKEYFFLLYVDHDHKTGKVRGLLCSQHNTMLGMAFDRPELLRAGADYLEAHHSFLL